MTDEAASVVTGYLETMSTVWLAEQVEVGEISALRIYPGRPGVEHAGTGAVGGRRRGTR